MSRCASWVPEAVFRLDKKENIKFNKFTFRRFSSASFRCLYSCCFRQPS